MSDGDASLAVVLPAAGRSVRYGGPRNKLLEDLHGKSVVRRALEAFLGLPQLRQIILATRDEPAIRRSLGDLADARIRFTAGGGNRAESVWNGVRAADDSIEWIAVHDAARPLASRALVDRTLAAARAHGAAVPALPVHLTIKQAAAPLPAPVQRTVPRHDLFAMQTPQVMRRRDLLAAFERCPIPLAQVTDDAQLIELAGGEVWLVDGEERNLKITTTLDLRLAELLLATAAP